ncbi:MAG TPA: alpha/beta hydrolase [Gammaproteobacteria bacterium]|nr:alpha/beta hydrolase [Gammaproteobacteria bacterium]
MLDLQIAAILKQAQEDNAPDFSDLTPEDARAALNYIQEQVQAPAADVETRDVKIEAPNGTVPLRIYSPRTDGVKPVLLYFHGGGFVIGGIDTFEGVTSSLAEKTGCIVVAVGYRLAPEYKFPTAVEDSYAALKWVAENASDINGNPNKIAVVGESAGGNLAAVCALLARDNSGPSIKLQVLIYPATAPNPAEFSSYEQYGEGYLLTSRSVDYFRRLYFDQTQITDDYRAAPLLANDLSNLPPATMIVARYDPLRDEGLAYAQRLTEAGTHVMVTEYLGMTHAFFTMTGAVDAAGQAVDQVASAVRQAMAR